MPPLSEFDNEKDIGVLVTNTLKPSEHCMRAAGTGMGVLCQLLRSFHYRDKTNFVSLYKTYVRPHLEFSVPTWNPWLRKDIEVIEKVQRKFIRNITCLKNGTYIEKLAQIELLTLEDRRIYLDMIEVYKMINGPSKLNQSDFFELQCDHPRRGLRSNDCPVNIIIKRYNLDIRRNFFTARTPEYWNKLPTELKLIGSLMAFKKGLKTHLIS